MPCEQRGSNHKTSYAEQIGQHVSRSGSGKRAVMVTVLVLSNVSLEDNKHQLLHWLKSCTTNFIVGL